MWAALGIVALAWLSGFGTFAGFVGIAAWDEHTALWQLWTCLGGLIAALMCGHSAGVSHD